MALTKVSNNFLVPAIAFALFLILISILVIYLIKKKRKTRMLFYHRYNKEIVKLERKYKESFKAKKFLIRDNGKTFDQAINANITNLALANNNIKELLSIIKKKGNIKEDIKSLDELPKYIDVNTLEDEHDNRLLQDLIRFFLSKRHKETIDWMLCSLFGNKNYYVHNKYIFYAYNSELLVIEIDKQKVLHPVLFKYDELDIKLNIAKETKRKVIYNFLVSYKEQNLINKSVTILKRNKDKYSEYNNVFMLVDSYSLYYKSKNILDASKKHAHIRKMNETTLKKIEQMSGRKFISWVQLSFKSLYRTSVEVKSDDELGMYLLMAPSKEKGLVVVCVKRHQDKIVSNYIRKLKELQNKNNADEAWIITNSEFTHISVSTAKNLNVRLINNSELKQIINKYNTNYYKNF